MGVSRPIEGQDPRGSKRRAETPTRNLIPRVEAKTTETGLLEGVPPQKKVYKFLELFAGTARLTRAVLRRGLAAHEAWELVSEDGSEQEIFDLRLGTHFGKVKSLIKRGDVDGIHGPPRARPSHELDGQTSTHRWNR